MKVGGNEVYIPVAFPSICKRPESRMNDIHCSSIPDSPVIIIPRSTREASDRSVLLSTGVVSAVVEDWLLEKGANSVVMFSMGRGVKSDGGAQFGHI